MNTPNPTESHPPFELGIYSFAELTPDPLTGKAKKKGKKAVK